MAFQRRIGAWMLAAFYFGGSAACVISPEPLPGPCNDNPLDLEHNCNDDNPCTIDTCESDGYCTNVVDDSLVPEDGNPCTVDSCVSGVDQHTSRPDGAACGLDGQLIMQVHDELVLEVAADAVDAVADGVRRIMQGAAALDVPLIVDIGRGTNWDEAH